MLALLLCALAFVFSALAIVIAMWASREWPRRKEIFAALRTGVVFSSSGQRGAFALLAFGLAAGLPAAFGFVNANALVLSGALLSSMLSRALMVRLNRDHPSGRAAKPPEPALGASCLLWFVLLSWTILGSFVLAGDFNLRTRIASEAALGPMLLREFSIRTLGLVGLLAGGIVAGAFWVSHLPPISGGKANVAADIVMSWTECCLAAVAVSAWVWGPSAGALGLASMDLDLAVNAAVSLAVTFASVIAVTKGRILVTSVMRKAQDRPEPALEGEPA